MSEEGCVKCRTILWYLIFFGTAMNYMVRTNINIAIVAMVTHSESSFDNEPQVSECFTRNKTLSLDNYSNFTDTPQDDGTRYDWNEHQQNLILGAFFWLYWSPQLPSGVLSNRYGGKLVFGLSNFIMIILGLFIPISTTIDYRLLIAIRAMQGLIGGFAWPSMHALVAKWVPPNERSRFITAYAGSSIGAAFTYPLCGLLIHWFGWPSVFYVSSGIGIIWSIAWWLLAFDSPAKHPRISDAERNYIHDSLGDSVSTKNAPIPWKYILKSIPMWLIVFGQWGNLWGLFTVLTQAPTYFKNIHGLSIQLTGLLSGIPHLNRMVFGYVMSVFCDYLLRTNKLSRNAVRKFATSVCCLGQALFMLGVAFSGCNYIAAIVLMTAAIGANGCEASGQLSSIIELSPNYASVLFGICNAVTVIPGFVSSMIVGYLTYQNQTVGQWQIVYVITAVMLTMPGILYICFGTSDLQPWNSYKQPSKDDKLQDREEREKLNPIKGQNIMMLNNYNSSNNNNILNTNNNNITE